MLFFVTYNVNSSSNENPDKQIKLIINKIVKVVKKIFFFSCSLMVFFAGMLLYGIILNSREISLKEAMEEKNITELEDISIVIDKKNYKLELYSGNILVKKYKAVMGRKKSKIKTAPNDLVTPTGEYKICKILNHKNFHKFFEINYPNLNDALECYKNGKISNSVYKKLISRLKKGECPPSDLFDKYKIGIHGIGKYDLIFRNLPFTFNWTNGSIALSNKNIDELSSVVSVGTLVKIKN